MEPAPLSVESRRGPSAWQIDRWAMLYDADRLWLVQVSVDGGAPTYTTVWALNARDAKRAVIGHVKAHYAGDWTVEVSDAEVL